MQVDFYQLSIRPVEQVLPRIAERLVDNGARLLIVAEDEALVARIDTNLWSYRDESFLPHAISGVDEDAAQPVLLSASMEATNGARNVALADGLWRAEALAFERAFYLFDDTTLDIARGAWRALAEIAGVERRYWKQNENGKWSQAA